MSEETPLTVYGLDDHLGADPAAGAVGEREPSGDGSMTRSEERLQVRTVTEATGRARLRKYIVTENVTTTIAVSREEVRLERVPLTDDDESLVGSDAPELTEVDYELVLFAERVVVTKQVVPVERVRLTKLVVTEDQQVNETIRREQIDADALWSAAADDR